MVLPDLFLVRMVVLSMFASTGESLFDVNFISCYSPLICNKLSLFGELFVFGPSGPICPELRIIGRVICFLVVI